MSSHDPRGYNIQLLGHSHLNGYDEVFDPDNIVLGVAGGGLFFYCIDHVHEDPYYELPLTVSSVPTLAGKMVFTVDGLAYFGPNMSSTPLYHNDY
jgi:hypothetical protein